VEMVRFPMPQYAQRLAQAFCEAERAGLFRLQA